MRGLKHVESPRARALVVVQDQGLAILVREAGGGDLRPGRRAVQALVQPGIGARQEVRGRRGILDEIIDRIAVAEAPRGGRLSRARRRQA